MEKVTAATIEYLSKQIESGADAIKLFDSWAGLVDDNNIEEYIYNPTAEIVDYVKSLKVPIICFHSFLHYINNCFWI